MFGNCCGRKKTKKKTETKDAETQSEYELLTVDEVAKHSADTPGATSVADSDCDKLGTPIVDQPLVVAASKANELENADCVQLQHEKNAETLEIPEEEQEFKVINHSPERNAENIEQTHENTDEIAQANENTVDINEKQRSPANEMIKDSEKERPKLPKQVRVESSEEEEEEEKHYSDSDSEQVQTVVRIEVTQSSGSHHLTNHVNHVNHSDSLEHQADIEDEVFEEGVGPPIKLARNMGKPLAKGQTHVPLPKWFSEEDDQEVGGIQEPPATPIGKDELALRRHRFFSELLSAAHNSGVHKVHFDPLGPSVVAGAGVDLPQAQELEQLVSRLENVTTRLENVCHPVQEILKLNSCSTLQELLDSPKEEEFPPPTQSEPHLPPTSCISNQETVVQSANNSTPTIAMSVFGYQDVMQGPFAQYLAVSQQLGGDVAAHAAMVKNAFDTQLQYIVMASESKQPSQADVNNLIQPTARCIQTIQEFREKNRGSPYFNHLSAISESIPALGWVAVSPTPGPYVKEMNDAGQFYTNRVLKEWREKDKKHVDWVKAWVQTLTELQAFVKQHHTTGLVWAGKKTAPTAGSARPPPPPGPPPPPVMDFSTDPADASTDRSALFAQINRGADITRGLKKVTDDMQTHKNASLRTGPAPFKAPTASNTAAAPVVKPPVFSREGKKWIIEYQKGNHNLVVDGAEMNNVVYLYRCTDSTVTVKGKINSITLDSCKKTSVVFDSLVSAMEFINCQSVQMQVLNKVPTISIDKTDGCQMYLSNESLNVEIVSSKSSEMNVLVPKPNGDYVEYPIPEQYKTTVAPGGLNTVIVESKG